MSEEEWRQKSDLRRKFKGVDGRVGCENHRVWAVSLANPS
jgi:hypothetical protein